MRIGERLVNEQSSPLYSSIQMTLQNSWKFLTNWEDFIWRLLRVQPHVEKKFPLENTDGSFERTGEDLKCQGHEEKKQERHGKKSDSSSGNKTTGKVER